ncbi:MAG: glycosyltransferase family 2 protein [Acidimicrobiales bacterium]
MKLVIQIPCLDEAETLPATLAALPRQIEGFDRVEWLVVDDGSTDDTVAVARDGGVDHLVRLPTHKGLAVAFQAGIDAALKLGADVVVNTDADGQYDPADIPRLVAPILAGEADLVVGDRGVGEVADFSWTKRRLQRLGSSVVSRAAGMSVPDATSGFRAYSRDAALGIVVLSQFTYTLETLIQAGAGPLTVGHVSVTKNPVDRPSRLFHSNWDYIRRSIGGILRVATFYSPLRTFTIVAALLGLAALASWYPFLSSWVQGDGTGRVQSIILGAIFAIAAVQVMAVGVLADLLSKQRGLSQETLERVRRLEMHLGVPPSHYEPGTPPDHTSELSAPDERATG